MIRTCTLQIGLLLMFAGIATASVDVRNVTFNTKSAGNIVFSHKIHMAQKEMHNNCKACHDGIFSIKNKTHSSMADMEKGKSCGFCHNSKDAFSIKDCARCHQTKDIIYQVKATGPTHFSHKKHIALNSDCASCHPKLFTAGRNKTATMADMKKGKSCGACHNGKKAFGVNNCTSCHPVKDITFAVKATGPTQFSHTKHIDVFECNECHTRLYATKKSTKPVSMTDMNKGKSCGACHNGKKAFAIKNCTSCHPAKELSFAVKETGATPFSHAKHIEAYGCGDCHTKLFNTSRQQKPVSMADMQKGKSCGACHNGKEAQSLKNCTSCHPTKELTYEVKDAGNVYFSHKVHAALFKCGECHETLYKLARSTVKVSMKAMESGSSCGACHDGKNAFTVKDKCDTCHRM